MSWWLKAIPWSVVIANAPAVVDGVKKLLDKRRPGTEPAGAPETLEARVAGLEQRERAALALLESLAGTNEQLVAIVDRLRRRARIQLGISVTLAIGVVAALVGIYSG
jgi:hypothetical protein